jgi:hypothetical protein
MQRGFEDMGISLEELKTPFGVGHLVFLSIASRAFPVLMLPRDMPEEVKEEYWKVLMTGLEQFCPSSFRCLVDAMVMASEQRILDERGMRWLAERRSAWEGATKAAH